MIYPESVWHEGGIRRAAGAAHPAIGAESLGVEQVARRAGLSPRQTEVALLLVRRLTNREIAERLGLRESTVRRHVEAVFMRLGISGRRQVEVRLRLAGEEGRHGRRRSGRYARPQEEDPDAW
jgi:DNA-binding NarL/FixJ family response regulator